MAQGKPDWFKLDPSKFLQDRLVDAMTTLELGITTRLLCRQWLDGFIQDDKEQLARLARVDSAALEAAWPLLSQFFPPIGADKRANRFMWEERELVAEKMHKKQEDGRVAVKKRWDARRETIGVLCHPNTDPSPDLIQDKDKDRDKENTPLPPTGGRKTKRRTLDQISEPYPDSVRAVANAVLAAGYWHRADPDGRVITTDTAKLCSNLDRIFKEHPGLSPDVVIEAAAGYLRKDRMRYQAAQWFFGRGQGGETPAWMVEVRMLQHQATRLVPVANGTHTEGE